MDNTTTEDQEMIREFLVESHENLSRLDQDLVELEKHPHDADLLSSIFRTIHTIKGACGFLAFSVLEAITHQAETLLSQLRDGQRKLTPSLVSLILETVDATRKVLASIEISGKEGPERFEDLTERLRVEGQLIDDFKTAPAGEVSLAQVVSIPAAEESAEKSTPDPRGGTRHDKDEEKGEKRGEKKDGAREEDVARSSAAVDANIRVDVGLLDKLMDLVGELVLIRNQILQFNIEREDPALNATSQRLNLITTALQEGVMKTRMQPIGVVWNKLPRVVRDMAMAMGKQIQLHMEGAETELDRTIIDAIKDPLMHLIRNSCDHGIEPPEVRVPSGKSPKGILSLRAYHEGGQVNIEIGDDGAGIDVARVKQKAVENGILKLEQAEKLNDREALNLIFQPGFSTAKEVTNFSGRGVGMDVVKSHIEKIGGVVDISSRFGEGATIKIRIPLTLAIIPGLVVTSGGERFVIPQVSLLELIRLEGNGSGKHIEYVHGTPVYRRRGRLLPIAYLNQVLGLKSGDQDEAVSMVVLQAEDRQFGLVVDDINDTQEIVVKPLGKQLKGLTLYAGATIMGDGRVALILDVLGIGQRSGVLAEFVEQARVSRQRKADPEHEHQRLLLFRAGSFARLAVPLSLVARLEEFPQSSIERASGGQVVQYTDLGAAMEAVNEGNIFRFLTKPCVKEVLVAAISSGVEQYELTRLEKELLEKTVLGSIKVLADVLGATSPEAFGRSLRIAQFVTHIASKFTFAFRWRLDAAATLSQLGCITLDTDLVRKSLGGTKLSLEEQARFDAHPDAAMRLLSGIPRLEPTAWMIGQQLVVEIPATIPDLPEAAIKETVLGAKVLKLAVAFDSLRLKLSSDSAAIASLGTRKSEFERELVDALIGARAVAGGMQSRRVSTLRLATGMVLDQDIRNKEGMLLIAKGQEITRAVLLRLDNFANAGLIDKEVQALVPM
jgi:two-component system, chemotaxis family, sensor kinase CheA